MEYGDEFIIEIPPGFDPDHASPAELNSLFRSAKSINRFKSTSKNNFIHNFNFANIVVPLCYKINKDCMIEINDVFLRTPIIIRNRVSDLVSFQFISSVKRSEFLGERKNVHNLGPAIIVTAIPVEETTYRMPRIDVRIRHVAVYTTLSNLMGRMGESGDNYPDWLLEILEGKHTKPRQRVLFLEEIHRDLIWSCFNLPVSGALLGHWMSAKFHELLCIGLQILKDNQGISNHFPIARAIPHDEKIRRARTILNREYANPPALPDLPRQLGISETQLKSSFKTMTGTTVLQYCIKRRIEAARLLLDENRHSISEISDIVGYEDHSAFSRAFRRLSGCSPIQWRQSQGT